MKNIKKKIGRDYFLSGLGAKQKKKLMMETQTMYDGAGRVVECIDKCIYELVQYSDKKGHPTRLDFVQIKRISKKPEVVKHKYFYDEDKLVSEYIHSPVRKLIQKIVYDYDNAGRLVHSTWAEDDGDVIWEDFYKYDQSGRKSEWINNHYAVNERSVHRYYYDERGRQITEDINSTLCGSWHYEYKYDTCDRIIEEAHYDKPGKVESKLVYTYDKRGHQVKFEYRGKITYGQLISERDEKGNMLRSKSYTPHLVRMAEYEYNKYGHVVRGVHTNYYCDCRGVRVQPYELGEYEYVYY